MLFATSSLKVPVGDGRGKKYPANEPKAWVTKKCGITTTLGNDQKGYRNQGVQKGGNTKKGEADT